MGAPPVPVHTSCPGASLAQFRPGFSASTLQGGATTHPSSLACHSFLNLHLNTMHKLLKQMSSASERAHKLSACHYKMASVEPNNASTHAAVFCRPDLLAITAQVSLPATPHTALQPGTPGNPLAGGACVVGYLASTAASRLA